MTSIPIVGRMVTVVLANHGDREACVCMRHIIKIEISGLCLFAYWEYVR